MISNGGGANARRWQAMLLALVASFTALTAVIATSDAAAAALDLTVARWAQRLDFTGWRALLSFGAYLTDKPAGPAVLGAVLLVLWLRRLPHEVIVLSIAQTIFVPQLWVKQLVHRPRPSEELISIAEIGDGFAFPSGHLTMGVAVYGMVAVIAMMRLDPGWRRNAVLGACAGILILSAISRPTVGAHWPSDALGGLLLGGISLFGTTWLYRRMRRPAGPPRPLRRPLALAERWLLATTPQRLLRRLRRA